MTTLLKINTSLFAEAGQSSRLADHFVETWKQRHPEGRVQVRDLGSHPLPHLNAERVGAFATPAEKRTPEQQVIVAESDALIAELKSADVVVLGLPMYNFGVPSTLKSYFDHIARAGVSFRYTATGPEGLLGDRKIYVVAARGGIYQGLPQDTQTDFVRHFLAFVGIRDVEFIYAEGLNMGPEPSRKAIETATAQLDRLAA